MKKVPDGAKSTETFNKLGLSIHSSKNNPGEVFSRKDFESPSNYPGRKS